VDRNSKQWEIICLFHNNIPPLSVGCTARNIDVPQCKYFLIMIILLILTINYSLWMYHMQSFSHSVYTYWHNEPQMGQKNMPYNITNIKKVHSHFSNIFLQLNYI